MMSTHSSRDAELKPSPGPTLPVTLATLKKLFPIRELQEEVLESFALDRRTECYSAGAILARRGELSDSVLYLLEGIALVDVGGQTGYQVESGTTRSRFPLCGGDGNSVSVVALSDVQVLRVCAGIMAQSGVANDDATVAVDPYDPAFPVSLRTSRLFQAFCQNDGEGTGEILPVPEVASRVRDIFGRKGGGAELGRLVAWDPILSAKLIGQANSPLYYPQAPITHFHDAVRRIGNKATQNLLVRCCVRKIAHFRRPEIHRRIRNWWQASVLRAAVCQVLAVEYSDLNPHEARLAGLVADIGELPYLQFADEFPANYWSPQELEQALPYVRPGLGAAVLNRWSFPGQLAAIPLLARSWHYDGGEQLTPADLVILANSLIAIGTPAQARQPAIDTLLAWGKLKGGGLTPQQALQVLQKARAMLVQLGVADVGASQDSSPHYH
jgi:HD-like signal output (HDOD) protein